MKTLKYTILGLLLPLFTISAEKTFFSNLPISVPAPTVVNNCLEGSLQIHGPIDFNYLNELANDGEIYLIIKSNKIINIPSRDTNLSELRNLSFLEEQNIFQTELNPVILFHNIKYLHKNKTHQHFSIHSDLCEWPNIACQVSRAIIGFFPLKLNISFEIDNNTIIPISEVNLVYDNKDLRSIDINFNKLYGYEFIKNDKVSNYYISQFLELYLENEVLKKLTIHFFSRTSYEEHSPITDIITANLHKAQMPEFTPPISLFLAELTEQNIFLCRKKPSK